MSARNYLNDVPQTTTTGALTAGQTSITIASATGYPTAPYVGALGLDSSGNFTSSTEVVLVTAAVGNVLTVTRGFDGTAAISHPSGETFNHVVAAVDLREANQHVNASAGVHGVAGAVVGTSDNQTMTNKTLTAPTINNGTQNSPTINTPTLAGAQNYTGTGLRKDTFNVPRVYTAGATWTKPARLLGVRVRVVGGGGGSGGVAGAGTGNAVSAGGGGGGYAEQWLPAASLGATETVTVGAGGTAGASGANAGGTGGTSSFGAHCSATGGTGGQGMTSITTNQKATAGSGGAGSGGDVNITGDDGTHGLVIGGFWNTASGTGGGSVLGGATHVNNISLNSAVPGNNYGGGAAGALATTTNSGGAAGAGGIVIVEELYF